MGPSVGASCKWKGPSFVKVLSENRLAKIRAIPNKLEGLVNFEDLLHNHIYNSRWDDT